MKKVFLPIIFTFLFVLQAQAQKLEGVNRWKTSPAPIRMSAFFLGAGFITYYLISPQYVQSKIGNNDFSFNKDRISVPEWAFAFGNHGPVAMTIGQFTYYAFSKDQNSFEKSYVLGESLLMAQGLTTILKFSLNQQRPDKSNFLSFPSGHATQAFAVGTWMTMELLNSNWLQSTKWPAYLPLVFASYVAWTRVDGEKHSVLDVLAGGLIGSSISYLMYRFHFDDNGKYKLSYKDAYKVTPFISDEIKGLMIRWNF